MPSGLQTVKGFNSVLFDASMGLNIQQFTIKKAEEVLIANGARGLGENPVVVTDGVPNRDWSQVKPYGKIEWIRQPILKEAALLIMAELVKRAPVGRGDDPHPGFYKNSFVYMVNRAQVDEAALDNLKPTDHVQIVNTAIYARKIEGSRARGRGSKRRPKKHGQSAQAPNGVFIPVFNLAVARYGRSMFIDFGYEALQLGNQAQATVTRRRTHGKKLRHPYQVAALYPSINLYIKTLI